MSVATDVVPVVYIPPRARPVERDLAPVISLLPPTADSIAAPLRLTRRGVRVLAAAVAVLAGLLVVLAWASAPAAHPATPAPAAVSVRAGDTLWSIAARVAPDRDPRLEVAQLQRINHLTGADLLAGDVLRTR
ncbi:MAG TPA: LysM peptidoglycan-binding domain-containing protein [Jatrophihabitantaceae bacterium]|jgi:hypothetical protein|nr:LysM peptidoglycan-binding domain-containing protein [Jatrophihabitantaceae bacterium]